MIDLVAGLFDLSPYEAARKIAADFGIDPNNPPKAAALAKLRHPMVKAALSFGASGPGDIPTLQEYLGYCLLPTTKAQKMLLLIGKGCGFFLHTHIGKKVRNCRCALTCI